MCSDGGSADRGRNRTAGYEVSDNDQTGPLRPAAALASLVTFLARLTGSRVGAGQGSMREFATVGIDIPGADWQPLPIQDAVDEFGIADDIECFFLDEPTNDALIHRGDLVVPGPLAVDGDDIQLHVIDGSLTVKGAFSFQNLDVYAALCITGSVAAQSMACIWDIQCVIGGSVNIDDVLVTQLTDAGWLAIRGGLTAGSWLQMDDRGSLTVNGPVSALRYSPEDGQAAIREEYLFDVERIRDGLFAGRPVLR